MTDTGKSRIDAHWRRKYRDSLAKCYRRLRALPVGAHINAEKWYGQGWATCESCLELLAKLKRPLFRIDHDGDPTIATKIR